MHVTQTGSAARYLYSAVLGAAVLITLLLSACTVVTAPPPRVDLSAGAEATRPATGTITDTVTETAGMSPTATVQSETVQPETLEPDTDALATQLEAELPIRGEDGSDQGFDGVQVLPLERDAESPLWLAHTYGIRPFDPIQNHFVALFTAGDDGWREVARQELECHDYIDPESVVQVDIEPEDLWLEAAGGAGAHSGCFALLRYDGQQFTIAAESTNASPGAGEVTDVDGDGQNEVVLNNTDAYVFCYACGVRLFQAEILRWNGENLVPVMLRNLAEGTDMAVQEANGRALQLAFASLFEDALDAIAEAAELAPDNENVYWNQQWIRYHAENRRALAEESPYPLLSWIFYGDYERAIEEMRGMDPAQIFDPDTPLIVGTPAEGWTESLVTHLLDFTRDALAADPSLAAAHYLHAWATYLVSPDDQAVLDHLEEAARLAPDDALFQGSLSYVSGTREETDPEETAPEETAAQGDDPAEITEETRVRFEEGATVHVLEVDPSQTAGTGHVMEIAAGQRLYVTARPGTEVSLLAPDGSTVPGSPVNEAVRFDIPVTGDYTLRLQSDQAQEVILHIPPLGDATQPVSMEPIQFPSGATGTTIDTVLIEGIPDGYQLRLLGRQHLNVTITSGELDFGLLDPEGNILTAYGGRTAQSAQYLIPRTGDYMLVVQGDGPATLAIEVPPLP